MYTPKFSETEKTAAQRSESVRFAVGVTMSQNLPIAPELKELYKRYIAGEIDLAYIDSTLTRQHPQVPTTDPRYQPGQPSSRYYPELVQPAEKTHGAGLDGIRKGNRQLVLE
jgi:hypothetical protein